MYTSNKQLQMHKDRRSKDLQVLRNNNRPMLQVK